MKIDIREFFFVISREALEIYKWLMTRPARSMATVFLWLGVFELWDVFKCKLGSLIHGWFSMYIYIWILSLKFSGIISQHPCLFFWDWVGRSWCHLQFFDASYGKNNHRTLQHLGDPLLLVPSLSYPYDPSAATWCRVNGSQRGEMGYACKVYRLILHQLELVQTRVNKNHCNSWEYKPYQLLCLQLLTINQLDGLEGYYQWILDTSRAAGNYTHPIGAFWALTEGTLW